MAKHCIHLAYSCHVYWTSSRNHSSNRKLCLKVLFTGVYCPIIRDYFG